MSRTPGRLLQAVLRASGMRNRMLAPERLERFAATPRPVFDGKPPKGFDAGLRVRRQIVRDWPVYEIVPEGPSVGAIVYLHGGAFVLPFSPATHWPILERLAIATGRTVFAPIYPLAPENSWRDVLPALVDVYEAVTAPLSGAPIAIIGDSAGGGLALSLGHALATRGRMQPEHIVLLSPWLDLSVSDPASWRLAKVDPVLNPAHLANAARLYAAGAPLTDPLLSPLHADFQAIDARISVFTGTHDLLNPDARSLRRRIAESGKSIGWHEVDGAMHTWMLAGRSELRRVVAQVNDELAVPPAPPDRAAPTIKEP